MSVHIGQEVGFNSSPPIRAKPFKRNGTESLVLKVHIVFYPWYNIFYIIGPFYFMMS